jgi:hypothetical protein
MSIDNIAGLRRPDKKSHSVVMLEDGELKIKQNLTLSEACTMFEGLNGSGIQAVVARTSEIIKKNV